MSEVDPREYRPYSNLNMILFAWLGPVMLLFMGGLFLYLGFVRPKNDGPPPALAAPLLVASAWLLWRQLLLPRRIVRHPDGRIEFVSPIRRVVLTPREIVSIRPDRRQFGFLVVKWGSGRLRLLNQFDGFHELLTYIESANPAVEIRGC